MSASVGGWREGRNQLTVRGGREREQVENIWERRGHLLRERCVRPRAGGVGSTLTVPSETKKQNLTLQYLRKKLRYFRET